MLCNFTIALTKKAVGARMGRGKGNIKNYVCQVPKNKVIFVFRKCT